MVFFKWIFPWRWMDGLTIGTCGCLLISAIKKLWIDAVVGVWALWISGFEWCWCTCGYKKDNNCVFLCDVTNNFGDENIIVQDMAVFCDIHGTWDSYLKLKLFVTPWSSRKSRQRRWMTTEGMTTTIRLAQGESMPRFGTCVGFPNRSNPKVWWSYGVAPNADWVWFSRRFLLIFVPVTLNPPPI